MADHNHAETTIATAPVGATTAPRIGIIGAGGMIGRVHARAAEAAGAELVAVSASTPERAQQIASELRTEPRIDPEHLLSDPDIDVVHICTPNHLHAPLTASALRHGKHVVCEKPVGVGLDELDEVSAEAAKRPELLIAVPFVYRFYPMVSVARQRMTDQRIWGLHGGYLQDWLADPGQTNWRVDPGLGGPSRAFADIGAHWCDLAEFLTGQRIARLTARSSVAIRRRSSETDRLAPTLVETEDEVALIFETNDGVLGTMLASQIAHGHKNDLHIEVRTERETIRFAQEQPDELVVGRADGTLTLQRDLHDDDGASLRHSRLPSGHPQGYQDAFDSFVATAYRSISSPEEDLPVLADGLRAMRITDAVLESALTNDWVEVPS